MSHTPTKKSVFDRIGASGGMSTSSSSSSASTSVTANVTNKSVCLNFRICFFELNKFFL